MRITERQNLEMALEDLLMNYSLEDILLSLYSALTIEGQHSEVSKAIVYEAACKVIEQ